MGIMYYLVEDREVYYTDDNGKKTKKADSSATLPDSPVIRYMSFDVL